MHTYSFLVCPNTLNFILQKPSQVTKTQLHTAWCQVYLHEGESSKGTFTKLGTVIVNKAPRSAAEGKTEPGTELNDGVSDTTMAAFKLAVTELEVNKNVYLFSLLS